MPLTAAQLVHNPDFFFDDLVRGDHTIDQLILGPESSFCPHDGHRAVEPHTGKIYCLICGDDVPPAQLEAERLAAAAKQPYRPEMELPV